MTPLLPDPAELREQLDHAVDTRDHLDRVIHWLKDGLELLGPGSAQRPHETLPPAAAPDADVPARQLTPSPEPEPEPEPAGSASSASSEEAEPEPPAATRPLLPRSPTRPRGRDLQGKLLAPLIRSNMPLSADQIAERAGVSKDGAFKCAIQALVRDRKVVAEGATKARRYRAASAPTPAADEAAATGDPVVDDLTDLEDDDGHPPADEVDAAWAERAAAPPPISPRVRRELERAETTPSAEPNPYQLTELQRKVIRLVAARPQSGRELATTLVVNVHSIGAELRTLVKRDVLRARGDGTFEIHPSYQEVAAA